MLELKVHRKYSKEMYEIANIWLLALNGIQLVNL